MSTIIHLNKSFIIYKKLAFAKKCIVCFWIIFSHRLFHSILNTLYSIPYTHLMLSTIHRRHILSYLTREKTTSLRALKSAFVELGEMNQTTLYRIMEKFLEEWIIHRAEFAWEKYFTLCQYKKEREEAIRLKCCMNCHTIEDAHSPLSPEAMKSETIELVKHCEKCEK